VTESNRRPKRRFIRNPRGEGRQEGAVFACEFFNRRETEAAEKFLPLIGVRRREMGVIFELESVLRLW